ncbi:hypothetical protein ARMSODRAFT_902796 [Armillaria solidipes]|uniref:Heterokaryon incompatibility domain-containing protein n=1 Tax=Armillaria solidipes TaxID=1076256 RepID=A0A2H3BZZ9_9AGAR|nr:hypothetical protein ARMSODRAFT_902796 [Armillaria solidipes]
MGDWRRLGRYPPEVTISAFTETGQEESSIIVPLQQAHTGTRMIPSRLADTPCATLGTQDILDQLNTTLGTSYSLSSSLSSLLEDFITKKYDFGIAYSHLRSVWYHGPDWSTIQDEFCRWEEGDRERRRKALVGNQVVNTWFPPRRLWDLFSNRVVPYWLGGEEWPRPISHAWVDAKDRVEVWTPINGYEWPVPIPKDADLNLIRIEMLNLGLRYVWLDVLCLRQVGGQREDLRTEEWKLDVPTIGRVYSDISNLTPVCYLSGLGRPLTLKEGDLESDRSWFRRAWTLQEVGMNGMLIAGDTPDGPLHAKPIDEDGKYETELLTRFHEQLQSTLRRSSGTRKALEEMQHRVSTNPVDRVAGLAFLMKCATIPAYYETKSVEEAWTALVNSLNEGNRAALFFLCPEPGNAGTKWRPSWDQVMMKPLPAYELYRRIDWGDEDSCNAECIEGLVRGLAVVEAGDRHGVLIVKDEGGIEHEFEITAAHTYPIPEDTYTLIYACELESSGSHGWVVGRSLPGGRFEKVATLEIPHEEQSRFEPLRIIKKLRYILI